MQIELNGEAQARVMRQKERTERLGAEFNMSSIVEGAIPGRDDAISKKVFAQLLTNLHARIIIRQDDKADVERWSSMISNPLEAAEL